MLDKSIIAAVSHRYAALDGWRGVSILCVLAAHLLPLGPHSWQLNSTVGPLGMAIFFTLSGFLIVSFLLKSPSVSDFLIRRFFRIVPLAWLYLVIVMPFLGINSEAYLPTFLFYANTPPYFLDLHGTSHFWSLCVEVQFYLGVVVLYGLMKGKGLLLIPVLCLAFTLYRVYNGVTIAIFTPFRIDEILAGSVLALIYNGKLGKVIPDFLRRVNPYLLFILLLIACHPESGAANYVRPYLAALLVGTTLYQNEIKLVRWLRVRPLIYIAGISYALYIIHPILLQTWLGSGDKFIEYLKRPILFMVLFGLAHLSTFYYEKYWISLGKKISTRLKRSN